MSSYRAYTTITTVADRPILLGSTSATVEGSAQGDLSFLSNGTYQVTRGLSPIVIVQYSPGSATYTLDRAWLEVFPLYESNANVDPSGLVDMNYVYGVNQIDMTRGLLGETDQDILMPYTMAAKPANYPGPSLDETDAYTHVYQVQDIWPAGVPMTFRIRLLVTDGSASEVTMLSAAWIVAH